MKVKDLIENADLEEVFEILHNRINKYDKNNEIPIEQVRKDFGSVVVLLLSYERENSPGLHTPIAFQSFDLKDESFIEVSLKNLDYEEHDVKDHNSALDKHNKYFSLILFDWSDVANTDIVFEDVVLSNEQALSHLLFEMAFYGFNPQEIKQYFKTLDLNAIPKIQNLE